MVTYPYAYRAITRRLGWGHIVAAARLHLVNYIIIRYLGIK